MDNVKFEGWCIVELMGRNQLAGKVSKSNVAGVPLLRIDVPAVDGIEAYTKYISGTAIYAITPTDEETAKTAASSFRQCPIELWRLNIPSVPTLGPGDDSYDEL